MKGLTLPTLPALLALIFLMPGTTLAQEELSYTYAELDYVLQDLDIFEDDDFTSNFRDDIDDGDGFRIAGSLGITEPLFIFGAYSDTELEYPFVDDAGLALPHNEDIKRVQLGGGFRMPMSTTFDLILRAAYQDIDIGDFNLGAAEDSIAGFDELETAFDDLNDDTSDGYFADISARAQLVDWLEGGVGLRYSEIRSDYVSVFGNLMFEITPSFGINLAADVGDDLSTYSAGLRFSF